MAQVYNHAIMPLATEREKRVQMAWGVADFRHRFGRAPEGMWLAETAADGATLDVLSDFGLRFTVLAPWQARDPPVDVSEPHWVPLPSGRRLAAFFYHALLSGGVSFNRGLTVDTVGFGHHDLPRHLHPGKHADGTRQVLTIATDGELYGHHSGALREDLRAAGSWRTGRTGADVLDGLRDRPAEETLPRAA